MAREAGSHASVERPERTSPSAQRISASVPRRRQSARSEVSQSSKGEASGTEKPSRNSPPTSAPAAPQSSAAAWASSWSTSSATAPGASPI